ncbi:hypothetical protein B0I37DRAFT_415403 [Chaetomium sp. MPI-CAGE-AT-0009]|nr:hypothetical protein B0I37DRAFT_415403 [Chaetomium sp. MPI-CAGE-AT-0009]
MQLPHLLTLTLPLLAAAVTTTTTSATTNPRGITDKIKGAFGDASAMVRDLSDCMVACTELGTDGLDVNKCRGFGVSHMDCWCQDGDGKGGDGPIGQAWENGVRECFASKTGEESRLVEMGCKPDGYEEGRFLGICKALEGESDEERNETAVVVVQRIREIFRMDEGEEGEERKGAVVGGNGTADGQGSGAAGPGVAGRVAGAAFAAVVAYAVAML